MNVQWQFVTDATHHSEKMGTPPHNFQHTNLPPPPPKDGLPDSYYENHLNITNTVD